MENNIKRFGADQATAPVKIQLSRTDIERLKEKCPLPVLLKRMHLEKFAVKSCPSPLRKDQTPSWGIFSGDDNCYRWKDFATGDTGDEVSFLAAYLGLNTKADFPLLLRIYSHFAGPANAVVEEDKPQLRAQARPDRSGLSSGGEEQLQALARLRGIRKDALAIAQQRGFLIFGNWHNHSVFGLTDHSGNLVEIRRLDGELFPAHGPLAPRKAHTLAGSQKSWPVGIVEAESYPSIALVEGIPDFLAFYQVALSEEKLEKVAPVAMLGGGCSIDAQVIPRFKNKHVRIFAHADKAGLKSASKWQEQLKGVAAKLDFIDFSLLATSGRKTKDLCDYKDVHAAQYPNNPEQWRLLP